MYILNMNILYLSYERGLEIEDTFCSHCGKIVREVNGKWQHTYSQRVKCKEETRGQIYTVASPVRADHKVMCLDPSMIYPGGLLTLSSRVNQMVSIYEQIRAFKPDVVIEREFNDGVAHYEGIYNWLKAEQSHVKRVWWAIDTHVSLERHLHYAENFDYVFCAIHHFVPHFEAVVGKGKAFWLPLCYPGRRDSIKNNYHEIKYPISFVGRWNREWFPERTQMIEHLQKVYGDRFHAETNYEDMVSIIKRSKVCVNRSIKDDLNFRVFEVLAAGTELVTNAVPDLYKIQGLATRVGIFQSVEELEGLIDPILADDPDETHNALKNQQWIRDNHTLFHRHNALLQMLASGQQREF